MKRDVVIDNIFALCFEGKFDKAKEELKAFRSEFGWMERAVHMELCVYSLTNDLENAKEFILLLLDEEIWLNPIELKSDDDLNNLRELNEFRELVQFSEKKYARLKEVSEPKIINLNHNETKKVFLWVHGRGSSLSDFQEDYKKMKSIEQYKNFYLQSSQVYAEGKYCWDDEEQAVREIKSLTESISAEKKIICGISQGGRVLFRAKMQNEIQDDILLIIPALYQSDVEEIERDGIDFEGTINIISGSVDPLYKNVCKTAEILKQKGCNIQFYSMDNVGHYLPDNFDEVLKQVI